MLLECVVLVSRPDTLSEFDPPPSLLHLIYFIFCDIGTSFFSLCLHLCKSLTKDNSLIIYSQLFHSAWPKCIPSMTCLVSISCSAANFWATQSFWGNKRNLGIFLSTCFMSSYDVICRNIFISYVGLCKCTVSNPRVFST